MVESHEVEINGRLPSRLKEFEKEFAPFKNKAHAHKLYVGEFLEGDDKEALRHLLVCSNDVFSWSSH